MPEETQWFTDYGGIGIGEEDDSFKEHTEHDYFLTLDAQGKTVEFGISKELYDQIDKEFNDISQDS